jgi:hypothetical protein
MLTKRKQGVVLPAVFSILGILAMIAFALTGIGMQSLGQANSFTQDDQALYAADAGLAAALAEHEANGELPASGLKGTMQSTGATWEVSVILNNTSKDMQMPGGAIIPPDTAYLVSEGQGQQDRAIRRTAALVQTGVGTVDVGTVALDKMKAEGSHLAAYDSGQEAAGYSGPGVDPDSILPSETVLATNASAGTPIELIDSTVEGTILVGPGGNPKDLILAQGTTTTQRQGSLTEEINVPDIEIPALPSTGDGDTVDEAALKSAQYFNPEPGSSDHVSFSRDASGVLTVTNQCFTCTIQPNGDFRATEAGGYIVEGNLRDGTVSNSNGYTADFSDGFKIDNGHWHGMSITPDGVLTVDAPSNDNGDTWATGSRVTYPAPGWLLDSTLGSTAEDLKNPDEITTGTFDEVLIDLGISDLASGSTVVMRDLIVRDGGQILLPDNAEDVTIYVTGKISITGENAILNKDRNAPGLKVFYTGTEDVEISGGAEAFLTLIAPNANVNLEGHGSTFYGALMGKVVNMKDASVFFDVNTNGVGTGTDGSSLKILSRHRL